MPERDQPPGANPAEDRPRVDSEQAATIVRLLGQILSDAHLYGFEHRVSMRAMEEGFETLTRMLDLTETLALKVGDDAIRVDDCPVAMKTAIATGLRDRLRAIGAANLTLRRGMTADEFVRLVLLLSERAQPAADAPSFAQRLASSGIGHVESRQTVLKEVSEDEVLVRRDEAAQAAAMKDLAGPRLEAVIAFLKSEATAAAPDGGAPLSAQAAAADPDKVAELIMAAAQARLETESTGSAPLLGDVVVGCLQRAYDSLSADPRARTQKGRRQVARTLAVIEENVLRRLADSVGGSLQSSVADSVKAAVESLQEDLQVEDLVGQYAKRRSALEDSERRMQRFLRRHRNAGEAADDVGQRLVEAGLAAEDWQSMLTRSEGGAGGSATAAVGPLLSEMKRLVDAVQNASGSPGSLATTGEASEQVRDRIRTILDGTERKIGEFAAVCRAAAAADAADPLSPARLSRQSIIEFLAEIVQELRQPISVCACALDMLATGRLADQPGVREQMVATALDGVRRLDQLVDRLLEVSGLPQGLAPDRSLISP